jgi:hypothetical protein
MSALQNLSAARDKFRQMAAALDAVIAIWEEAPAIRAPQLQMSVEVVAQGKRIVGKTNPAKADRAAIAAWIADGPEPMTAEAMSAALGMSVLNARQILNRACAKGTVRRTGRGVYELAGRAAKKAAPPNRPARKGRSPGANSLLLREVVGGLAEPFTTKIANDAMIAAMGAKASGLPEAFVAGCLGRWFELGLLDRVPGPCGAGKPASYSRSANWSDGAKAGEKEKAWQRMRGEMGIKQPEE